MSREIIVPIVLPVVLPGGTGAADLLTDLILPFSGEIVDWAFVTTVVSTGAGATRTFNVEIGTTNVGGTATAIALADTDTVGKVKELGAASGDNRFRKDEKLSIEVAAGGTAFTAGEGYFIIWARHNTRGI